MLFLQWYLWIAPQVILLACLLLLLRRGATSRYPLLIGYMGFEIAVFLALLSIGLFSPHRLNLYRWVWVVGSAVNAVLEIAIVNGLASELVLARTSLARILRPLLRWTIAALILLASGISASFPSSGISRVVRIFQTLDFSSNLLKLGLILLLLVFTKTLAIRWRSLSAGIALGFGIVAACELVGSALISVPKAGFFQIDIVRLGGFHLCVLTWLVYMLLPERKRAVAHNFHESDLKRWNEEVENMLGPKERARL